MRSAERVQPSARAESCGLDARAEQRCTHGAAVWLARELERDTEGRHAAAVRHYKRMGCYDDVKR
jgi:hypothetical protein